jgi:hypothetical protein
MYAQESLQYADCSTVSETGQCLIPFDWMQNNDAIDDSNWQPPDIDGRQISWNPQIKQYEHNAMPGVVLFEPPCGSPFEIWQEREEILAPSLTSNSVSNMENVSLAEYGEQHVHESLPLQNLVREEYHQEISEAHNHVFSALHGAVQPRSLRESKRLTPEQRKQTQEVRKLGACWACHLSKIKVCYIAWPLGSTNNS